MIPSRTLGALSAALLLAACQSGPDYEKPEITLASYHAAPEKTAEAPSLDRWWSGFNDPALSIIVERALSQNLDLAASMARVQQARAVARRTGSRLMPSGEFQASAAPLHQSLEGPIGSIAHNLPGYDRNFVDYNAGAGASWEIDLAGGLHRDVETADALAQVAEAEQAGVRVSVAADAADAYLQIRGYQARLAFAQAQIEADTHLLGLVKLRQTRGVATDREVAQADALTAQARALVPPLRIGLEAQLNRLDVLLGAQPGTYAKELSVVAEIPAIPGVDPADPADLLRRRPDVIAAERKLAASNAHIGSAVSEYYPKLSLSALLGFDSISSQQFFTSAAFQPQAMAGLRWRLFDFGKVDAEVDQAKGANAEALALYRAAVLRATEDVENALTALAQEAEETRELSRETASLTRARDTAEEAYRGGAVSLLDVLDSDRQLLIAQDDLARVRADTARSAVGSYRALGGGW